MKKVLSLLRRADQDFKMILPGDRVMAGVSGGKDSMALLTALALYRRFSDHPFTLCGGMIDMGYPDFDAGPLLEYCKTIDVELHIKKTNIGRVIFETRKEDNPCSLCAKMRRGSLNELAQRHGCNKIALGHHRDDLLETLLMSMIYESRMRTFSPVMWMSRADIVQIRPLIYLEEREIGNACMRNAIPTAKNPCPASSRTKRAEMKELLKHIRTLCPEADIHMFRAIQNTENYGLWDRLPIKKD